MLKKILLFIFLIISASCYAGTYEKALSGDKDVFLYIYTQDCMMCQRFNPRFEKLKQMYPNLKFISVDAETPYGMKLMWKFGGRYVPFLVLSKHKTGKSVIIQPSCSIDEMCMNRAIKEFK